MLDTLRIAKDILRLSNFYFSKLCMIWFSIWVYFQSIPWWNWLVFVLSDFSDCPLYIFSMPPLIIISYKKKKKKMDEGVFFIYPKILCFINSNSNVSFSFWDAPKIFPSLIKIKFLISYCFMDEGVFFIYPKTLCFINSNSNVSFSFWDAPKIFPSYKNKISYFFNSCIIFTQYK